jgi:exonuclease SbcD
MRILHTSDWHLGRSFGPASLQADQEAFLDWLVEVVEAERVDLVVVAGDLYDRAIPPTESVALLRETLDRLVSRRVRVVAITGNHDGPDRVAAYDGLTDLAGVVVRGGYARAGMVTTLELDDGPLDVVAVPYLDPVLTPAGWSDAGDGGPSLAEGGDVDASPELGWSTAPVVGAVAGSPSAPPSDAPVVLSLFDELDELDEADEADALDGGEPSGGLAEAAPTVATVATEGGRGAARRSHHSVLAQALRTARSRRRSPRSLAVAHAFVSGALPSESERLLTVGGAAEVGTELFDGFDYVALGHLHRPQRVRAGLDTIRYSGTPLPYSFSETHPKQVLIVDMAADGSSDVRSIEVPVGRPVATVTGTIDELLAAGAHERAVGSFVRAVLTDRGYVVDAKTRLQARFPHVVEVVHEPVAAEGPAGVASPERRRRLAPLDAAVGFWLDVTGEEPEEVERSLLESVLAHVASERALA